MKVNRVEGRGRNVGGKEEGELNHETKKLEPVTKKGNYRGRVRERGGEGKGMEIEKGQRE